MNVCPSWHNSDAGRHNVLVPTLDLLQRRAYYEIMTFVRYAINERLPAEVTDFIFEQTLAAEDMPEEPRVLVKTCHIQDEDRVEHERAFTSKCLFPCPHVCRCGETTFDDYQGDQGFCCACNDGYVVKDDEFIPYPERISRHITTASGLRAAEWTTADLMPCSDAVAERKMGEQEAEMKSWAKFTKDHKSEPHTSIDPSA